MRRLFHILALLVIGLGLVCWMQLGVPQSGVASPEGPDSVLIDDYWPLARNGGGTIAYVTAYRVWQGWGFGVEPLYGGMGPVDGGIERTIGIPGGEVDWGNEIDRLWVAASYRKPIVWDLGAAYQQVVAFPMQDSGIGEWSDHIQYTVWGSNAFDANSADGTDWNLASLAEVYRWGWSDVGEDKYEVCGDDFVNVWEWRTGGAYRYVKLMGPADTKGKDPKMDAVKGVLAPGLRQCDSWGSGVVEEGSIFEWTSLEVGTDDRVHVAYGGEQLFYALRCSGCDNWHVQEVDKGGVGAYCSLALDGLGRPAISYYDAANGDLKYAYQNGTLNAVWGASSTDVYAVGDNGTIIHYDGATWVPMASPTTQSLRGIWGSSWNNIFAVGDGGVILRGNGYSWSLMSVPGGTGDLHGVWGSSATNVLVVGAGGTIRRFDGSAWTAVDSGTASGLYGVWGSSATNVFAVGDGGTIRRYDGSAWSSMDSGTARRLSGVWGTSATNVFAVGDSGTIRRFNGTNWSSMTSMFTDCLNGVWGSSASDVFAVGCRGAVLHYNGSTWTAMTSSTTEPLRGVWGSASTNVLAVGHKGAVVGYDGAIWDRASRGDGWLTTTVDRLGDVGRHTSLAFDAGGRPAISYYDATNCDLKYASWSGTGWDIKTVDGVGWVGEYTSLAFDNLGWPAISYYDATDGDLKLAMWDGLCWVIGGPTRPASGTVDTAGDVGRYSSLAFDGSWNPAVSYHDATLGTLKYAHWDGLCWCLETVETEGWVGEYTSLAFDNMGRPGISHYDALRGDVRYAHWDDTGWKRQVAVTRGEVGTHTSLDFLSGSDDPVISYYDATKDAIEVTDWSTLGWRRQRVDYYPWTGRFSSLAFDEENQAAVSFYDAREGDLRLARWQEDHWEIGPVDIYGDVGLYTSLVFDDAWNPAISYYEMSRGDLKYASWNGTTWDVDVVDSANDVGSYSSLALDDLGNPAISYYDATNGDLMFCRWDGAGWLAERVDRTGDVGSYSSLGFDASGNPGISYYDATNGDLKCAHWDGRVWLIDVVDSAGDVGRYSSLHYECLDDWGISYYDATNGDLKYAQHLGPRWQCQTVDSKGQVGLYTSLEADASGYPAISYQDASGGMVKLARWDAVKWTLVSIEDIQTTGQWTSLAFDRCWSPAISYDSPVSGDLEYASVWNSVPYQPLNQSPANGATCVSLTPPLQASVFTDNCSDSHRASRWVISTDNCMTETNIVFDSGTDRLNRSQMEVPPGVLERSTIYYWAVSYRDCHGAWSKYSLVTGFTTASLPQQPENVSPADGATGISINPTLRSSAFASTWSGDTHVASQWQISENPGDYASPVFDQTTQTVNLIAITVPTDLLSNQTTYFWRVRHQGSCGESWSEFSEETSFFVNRSAPQKPVNQSPTDGEDGTDLTALLVSSPFVDTDIGDSQQAAQWRVTATAGDYTSPVFDSGADNTKLTEMKVPSGDLEPEQTYYWQVRHQDSYGTWSEWSDDTGFTTAEPPSVPMALVVAAAVVAVIVVGGLTASMVAPPL